MTTRRVAAVVLVGGLLGAPTVLGAQAIQRAVYVSALDKDGTPVTSLDPSDVVIREDNVPREVLRIAPAAEPMQVAILVDNSTAAESFIRDYREALPAFIAALTAGEQPGARNEIALVSLADRPTILVDSTFSREQLLKGVGRLFSTSGSGTVLLDGIIEVSKGMTKRRSPRPVIIAITTEGLELSDRAYPQVLEPLRESGAALHVIVLGRPVNNSQDRTVVLAQGPSESGGQYVNLLTGTALTSRLKQVAVELTHQLRVTYARPQTLIPPKRVTVSSGKPGLTVRGTPVVAEREQERP